MEIIKGIGNGAPVWVWPLLVGLILIGYQSTKQRKVPVVVFYLLPLIGLVSLNSFFSLPDPSLAAWFFGFGYFAGAGLGFVLQRNWLIALEDHAVTISGEWFTLTVLMILFWANFVRGTVQAISQETYSGLPFLVVFALVIGAASGSFLGRAVRVIRYARKRVW